MAVDTGRKKAAPLPTIGKEAASLFGRSRAPALIGFVLHAAYISAVGARSGCSDGALYSPVPSALRPAVSDDVV